MITYTQANLIIGLLAIIATGIVWFLGQDLYWNHRAKVQRRRDEAEARARRLAQVCPSERLRVAVPPDQRAEWDKKYSRRCNMQSPARGYAQCTREFGHDGPCAMPHASKAEFDEQCKAQGDFATEEAKQRES